MEMTAVLVEFGFWKGLVLILKWGRYSVCLYVDWCPGAVGQLDAAEGHSVLGVVV